MNHHFLKHPRLRLHGAIAGLVTIVALVPFIAFKAAEKALGWFVNMEDKR